MTKSNKNGCLTFLKTKSKIRATIVHRRVVPTSPRLASTCDSSDKCSFLGDSTPCPDHSILDNTNTNSLLFLNYYHYVEINSVLVIN